MVALVQEIGRLAIFCPARAIEIGERVLRYRTKPRPAKPSSIIAEVDGSGTPVVVMPVADDPTDPVAAPDPAEPRTSIMAQ